MRIRTPWALTLALTLASVVPVAAQTSLTIYQDGRVLQRRTLPVRVPAGSSNHRLTLGALEAGSLFALDAGVTILGAWYDPAIDQGNALRRAVGTQLTFETRGANGARELVVATVLGVDPERYRLSDGKVVFERPGTPLFPAELVPADAALAVALRAERAVPALGLGFFSSGASWAASYAVVLGRPAARISGHATIAAGTLRADSAEVQLLAGDVGRAPKAQMVLRETVRAVPMAMADAVATEAQVGESHLYTLAGRHTLIPGVETVAALFEPASAPVERTYTVRGQVPYYGGLPQFGEEQPEPVNVTYVVKRPAKTPFGDVPIPGGTVRIYDRDPAGRPQLIGEAAVGHTAAGQDLRLDAGTAFDLTARRTQTTYETTRQGQRTIATATYVVNLANARDSIATIDVLEQRAGEWSVVTSSIPAEKISSTVTRFRVRVPARGEASLTYRVRVVW
ncbi:MAG: hypothetical protein SFV24_13365 [Gemmatimonadales bacterium]|nr:hypothetical protein [Gemmatimonadales bacterium]